MSDAVAVEGSGLRVTIVRACLRDGSGGSPTAVLEDRALSDEERRRVPVLMGTSHAVFVSAEADACDGREVSLRFFTAEGELPACGHGTVAALAFLAERDGARTEYEVGVRTPGRVFSGRVGRVNGQFNATFDPGPVDLAEAAPGEVEPVLRALGITPDALAGDGCVASLGRARLLLPVADRFVFEALAPDFAELRAACDRLGLLGCYVHCSSATEGRIMARMFAPSIGVPEDIANANSTACLAACLAAREGITDVTVDMGDSLGTPSTITAGVRHGETGAVIYVGGSAAIA